MDLDLGPGRMQQIVTQAGLLILFRSASAVLNIKDTKQSFNYHLINRLAFPSVLSLLCTSSPNMFVAKVMNEKLVV